MIHLFYLALYLFYAGIFLFCISRLKFFEIEGTSKKLLAFFFLLKLAGGVLLTLIYTYYYTDPAKADIYRYFHDSKIISSVLFVNPVAWLKIISGIGIDEPYTFHYVLPTLYFSHPENDLVTSNSFFIRIISLFNYFSFYNIYIDTLFLNFITFTGLVALFKALKPYFIEFEKALYLPIFLLPSVIFWGSGMLKESLLLFGACIYLYAWPGVNKLWTWRNILLMAIALVIVALTKIHVAALLVLCSAFLPFGNVVRGISFSIPRRIASLLFVGIVAWYFWGGVFCEKIIQKRNEFVLLAVNEKAGSSLDTKLLGTDCNNIVSIIPGSFVNSVLRPFIWDRGTAFQIIFAVENLFFFVIIAALIIFFFKRPELAKLRLAVFCFIFAFSNYLIIGITAPVMGVIVHYRVIAMPFLLLGVLLLIDIDKLKRYFYKVSSS